MKARHQLFCAAASILLIPACSSDESANQSALANDQTAVAMNDMHKMNDMNEMMAPAADSSPTPAPKAAATPKTAPAPAPKAAPKQPPKAIPKAEPKTEPKAPAATPACAPEHRALGHC